GRGRPLRTSATFERMPGVDASLFPVFLKLAGRDVVVVGAGAIAERKVEALVGAGGAPAPVPPWRRRGHSTPSLPDRDLVVGRDAGAHPRRARDHRAGPAGARLGRAREGPTPAMD